MFYLYVLRCPKFVYDEFHFIKTLIEQRFLLPFFLVEPCPSLFPHASTSLRKATAKLVVFVEDFEFIVVRDFWMGWSFYFLNLLVIADNFVDSQF